MTPFLGGGDLGELPILDSLSGRGLILAKLESGLILVIVQTTGTHLREPRHQVRPFPMVKDLATSWGGISSPARLLCAPPFFADCEGGVLRTRLRRQNGERSNAAYRLV